MRHTTIVLRAMDRKSIDRILTHFTKLMITTELVLLRTLNAVAVVGRGTGIKRVNKHDKKQEE